MQYGIVGNRLQYNAERKHPRFFRLQRGDSTPSSYRTTFPLQHLLTANGAAAGASLNFCDEWSALPGCVAPNQHEA